MVEAHDLLAEVEVLQQARAARPGPQRVVGVLDQDALIGRHRGVGLVHRVGQQLLCLPLGLRIGVSRFSVALLREAATEAVATIIRAAAEVAAFSASADVGTFLPVLPPGPALRDLADFLDLAIMLLLSSRWN